MKSFSCILLISLMLTGCSSDGVAPEQGQTQLGAMPTKSCLLSPIEFWGHIRFPDGSPAPQGTFVTAYLNSVEMGHDQCTASGEYGISGDDGSLPTGTYEIVTEVVHKGNKEYIGGGEVEHVYGVRPDTLEITLLRIESR